MSAISREWLEKEIAARGKTQLGNNFGLSAGNFNALIKVMETNDEPNDPDGFDRLITQALRQSVSQFARIEKLENELMDARNNANSFHTALTLIESAEDLGHWEDAYKNVQGIARNALKSKKGV